jgi:hypothetical protein
MGYTLEQLSSTCRDILTADRGPEGRKQVCAVVRDVLLDTAGGIFAILVLWALRRRSERRQAK